MKKKTNQANYFSTTGSASDFTLTTFSTPKTRVQIIQELLDKKAITAEEAVTLLTPEKEYVYVPQYPINPYPLSPTFPGTPIFCNQPSF